MGVFESWYVVDRGSKVYLGPFSSNREAEKVRKETWLLGTNQTFISGQAEFDSKYSRYHKVTLDELRAGLSSEKVAAHKSWYVVDVFLKKYLGPYPSKNHAEQTGREMRKIVPSDLFLEITTNILVVDEDKFSEWGSSFERTNMKELRKKYGPDKTAGIIDRYVKESSLGITPRKKSKIATIIPYDNPEDRVIYYKGSRIEWSADSHSFYAGVKREGERAQVTVSAYKRFGKPILENPMVNWSALGDVDAETARTYAQMIQVAAEIAEEVAANWSRIVNNMTSPD